MSNTCRHQAAVMLSGKAGNVTDLTCTSGNLQAMEGNITFLIRRMAISKQVR